MMSTDSPAPTVSAVICTRNRPVDLRRTLQSLAWQETPCHEVLVVDDSDPERRHETESVCADVDLPIRIMTKDEPGLTASRNLAIEHVSGEITIFFDDDVVLRPDYLTEMAGAFAADSGVAGAGGSIDDDHVYGWRWLRALLMVPGRTTGRVYRSGWSSQLPIRRTQTVEHLIGCNMAYRTAVLRRYRFNADFQGYALGEDLELSHRMTLDGHRLVSVGTAHIWHITALPRHDLAWGYREMVIRPIVAGRRFSRAAFLVSALTFLATNTVRNRDRARGNWIGIRDVLRRSPPRDHQTLVKAAR
jgi:glycosyltransferase involved in cell wall biosynthesis